MAYPSMLPVIAQYKYEFTLDSLALYRGSDNYYFDLCKQYVVCDSRTHNQQHSETIRTTFLQS